MQASPEFPYEVYYNGMVGAEYNERKNWIEQQGIDKDDHYLSVGDNGLVWHFRDGEVAAMFRLRWGEGHGTGI